MRQRMYILPVVATLLLSGCTEEKRAMSRAAPSLSTGQDLTAAKARKKKKKLDPAAEAAKAEALRPKRILTREDFDLHTRDPFHTFALQAESQVVEAAVDAEPQQRPVKMSQYTFEELRLVGIVMSQGSIQPRALFVGSDGKSRSVKQGEYFSRAEVLLAAINSDYIEIEVVDENLASGLNMQQGERRAVYLKTR